MSNNCWLPECEYYDSSQPWIDYEDFLYSIFRTDFIEGTLSLKARMSGSVSIQQKTTKRKPSIMSPARTTSKSETASLISEDAKESAGSEPLLRTMTVIRQNVQTVTELKYGRNHSRIISGFIYFLRKKDILQFWNEEKTMYC